METNDPTLSASEQDTLETKLHNLVDAAKVELGAKAVILISLTDHPVHEKQTRMALASLGLKPSDLTRNLLQVAMTQTAHEIGAPIGSVAFQIVFSALVLKALTNNEEGDDEPA